MVNVRIEAIEILDRYETVFGNERFLHLRNQLGSEENCFDRSNMRGHVTTSAAVLHPDQARILLIHHKGFDRWLPPGGHYEGGTTLWDSAAREVLEETGVTIRAHEWTVKHRAPIHLDTHQVPGRPSKGEGDHWHHDFRFLAVAENDELVPQLEEVYGARWAPLAELDAATSKTLAMLAKKLKQII